MDQTSYKILSEGLPRIEVALHKFASLVTFSDPQLYAKLQHVRVVLAHARESIFPELKPPTTTGFDPLDQQGESKGEPTPINTRRKVHKRFSKKQRKSQWA